MNARKRAPLTLAQSRNGKKPRAGMKLTSKPGAIMKWIINLGVGVVAKMSLADLIAGAAIDQLLNMVRSVFG